MCLFHYSTVAPLPHIGFIFNPCKQTWRFRAHLQLSPQAAFTAADAVHDPGDVFKVQAELLLTGGKREQTEGGLFLFN